MNVIWQIKTIGVGILMVLFSLAHAEGEEERQTVRRVLPQDDLTEAQDFTGLLGYQPYEASIYSIIKNDSKNFGFLAQAVQAAGLKELLKEAKSYTVFAPTDEAFAKLSSSAIDEIINPLNQEQLAELLKNHIVPRQLLPEELKTMKIKNLNDNELAIEVKDGALWVNGAKLVNKGTVGANGIIYAIDKVLNPRP